MDLLQRLVEDVKDDAEKDIPQFIESVLPSPDSIRAAFAALTKRLDVLVPALKDVVVPDVVSETEPQPTVVPPAPVGAQPPTPTVLSDGGNVVQLPTTPAPPAGESDAEKIANLEAKLAQDAKTIGALQAELSTANATPPVVDTTPPASA